MPAIGIETVTQQTIDDIGFGMAECRGPKIDAFVALRRARTSAPFAQSISTISLCPASTASKDELDVFYPPIPILIVANGP